MLTTLDTKLLAIFAVSIGSFIFGSIPAVIGLGSRFKHSTVLSSTLCFGGGVLFATSVIHILPDVRTDLPNWSELVFCLGFFFIYMIDVFISTFYGKQNESSTSEGNSFNNDSVRTYGAVEVASEPVVSFNGQQSRGTQRPKTCMNFGLLIAFSVHSLLEGLVIGIQDTPRGVLLLLGAVCSHKLLVAFCLGAELVADGQPWQTLICPMSVFIFGSDVGIILGMIFQADDASGLHSTVPLIEGLAGGTLLYIALCEIIPRERARKLPPYAAFVQFAFLSVGFGVMTALTILL